MEEGLALRGEENGEEPDVGGSRSWCEKTCNGVRATEADWSDGRMGPLRVVRVFDLRWWWARSFEDDDIVFVVDDAAGGDGEDDGGSWDLNSWLWLAMCFDAEGGGGGLRARGDRASGRAGYLYYYYYSDKDRKWRSSSQCRFGPAKNRIESVEVHSDGFCLLSRTCQDESPWLRWKSSEMQTDID